MKKEDYIIEELGKVSTVADEANAQALFTALMTDTLLEEEEE